MRSRARLAAVIAAVLALLAVPAVQPEASASSNPAFTRVRITVTSSSDWTTVSIRGVDLLDQSTASVAPGGQVVRSSRGFAFHMQPATTGAVAVVDEVLQVSSTATPVLRVDKGDVGSVQVAVDRTNVGDVPIASLDTGPGRLGDGYVSKPIDRATLIGESLQITPVDARRLVLAFYYPWFPTGSFQSGVWYDRPASAYATDDPTSVATMVDQAQSAGINGFIVSWNGSDISAQRLDLLEQVAATRPGFSIATYLELAELQELHGGHTDIAAIEAAAIAALSRSTEASYLKVGDRPVLFVYGTWTLLPDVWQTVMTDLANQGYHPFVIGDSANPDFSFDGFHIYNPNNMDAGNLRSYDWTAARRLRIPHVLHPEIPQQLWAATVSPGQNTVGRHGTGTYRPREDGLRYDQTWSAALASSPDWVLITSWNEWFETTQIQPSQNAGWRAVNQTRTWSTRFHSS